MRKIDKLLKIARSRVPPEPPIDFSYASRDELLELINDETTPERFQEIVDSLRNRAGKGNIWQKSG